MFIKRFSSFHLCLEQETWFTPLHTHTHPHTLYLLLFQHNLVTFDWLDSPSGGVVFHHSQRRLNISSDHFQPMGGGGRRRTGAPPPSQPITMLDTKWPLGHYWCIAVILCASVHCGFTCVLIWSCIAKRGIWNLLICTVACVCARRFLSHERVEKVRRKLCVKVCKGVTCRKASGWGRRRSM